MAGGLGIFGYIGMAPETSGGVAVVPTQFFPALSEDITLEIERFDTQNISSRITEPDDEPGLRRIAGNISAVFDPVTGGHLLRCGVDAATVTSLGGGLFRHSFTPPSATQWDTRFALRPYTFEVNRDVGSAQQYAGCNIDQLEFVMAPNAALQVNASLIGMTMTHRAVAVATYALPSFFNFATCSISIAGAAETEVEGFTFAVQNNLEGVPTLANRNSIWKIRRTDAQTVRLQMTLSFEDIVDFNRFLNQTDTAVKFFMLSGSYSLLLDLPRVVYASFPTGMNGRGRQTVQIDSMVRYHAGSATAYDIVLVSPVAAY